MSARNVATQIDALRDQIKKKEQLLEKEARVAFPRFLNFMNRLVMQAGDNTTPRGRFTRLHTGIYGVFDLIGWDPERQLFRYVSYSSGEERNITFAFYYNGRHSVNMPLAYVLNPDNWEAEYEKFLSTESDEYLRNQEGGKR